MSNVEVTRDAPRTVHPPIDTSVKLPPSVLALAARAEAAHKAAYTAPDPNAPPAAPAAPAAGDPPPVAATPPAPPPAPVAPPAPSVDTLAEYAPPGTEAPPAPETDASWEHRYKSMQGRFNAQSVQMRQMQQQMTEMGTELVASQRRMDELQRGTGTAVIQRPQPGPGLLTDKDRTDFGDEFLDVAARAAQERILPEVAAARQEVKETRAEVHQMKLGRVYDALDAHIGKNWRNVNRHPKFAGWLALRDPLSGAMRQQLLDGAMQAADAARVVNIFRGFLAEDAASRPAAPASQPPPAPVQPAAGQRQPAVTLESLAAPGRASSAPGSPPAAEKPVYTRRDIDKFYDDVRRGRYAGREAEKSAIEFDIVNVAPREGRVR